jgi:trans-2,3-dihydro-3-hydroxyanthranilate isomerase
MNCLFYQVDVFTKVPFGGNPLAIVFNSEGLTDDNMQNIAREMNLSETTFVLPPGDLPVDFLVRIFTPKKELLFAGHPSLGTAHILRETGKVLSGDYPIKLSLKAGVVTITQKGKDNLLFMDQLAPSFQSYIDCTTEIGNAIGISKENISSSIGPIQIVSTGLPVLIVPVASLKALKNITVDTIRLKELLAKLDADLLYAFTMETLNPKACIHSRAFAPELGITEDPATGSAAGAVGAYLSFNTLISKDECKNILIEQGYVVSRPSSIFVCVEQMEGKIRSVKVGGYSVTVIQGNLSI